MQKETCVGSFDVHLALNPWSTVKVIPLLKKGRDPSHSIFMVNLWEGWVKLRLSRKWPAVILSGIGVRSVNYVKQQLNNLILTSTLNVTVQPVFVNPKLEQQLKPPIVNQKCFVNEFECNLCGAGYKGYTRGHLHERVEGRTRKSSSICKHHNLQHNSEMPECVIEQFHIITKCGGK